MDAGSQSWKKEFCCSYSSELHIQFMVYKASLNTSYLKTTRSGQDNITSSLIWVLSFSWQYNKFIGFKNQIYKKMINPFHTFPKAIYAIRFFYLSRDILFIYKQISFCFVQIKVTYFYMWRVMDQSSNISWLCQGTWL